MDAFFRPRARERLKAAIEAAESHTSAELVVTARRASSPYVHGRQRLGGAFALGALLALLFLPTPFALASFPVDLILAYGLGTWLCPFVRPLHRLLVAPATRRREVDRAAKQAFFDLGITRTAERTGMLIYLSALERQVQVLVDFGLEPDRIPDFSTQTRELESCFVRGDLEGFARAVEDLGRSLGQVLPRAADDVNELPDEMVVHS